MGNEEKSQTKLLYTKVQLNSEGALLSQPVDAYWLRCAQPPAPDPYARIDGSFTSLHLCFPPPVSVCLESDASFFFLSVMYSLLQSCVCPQTGTLLICTVLSLG